MSYYPNSGSASLAAAASVSGSGSGSVSNSMPIPVANSIDVSTLNTLTEAFNRLQTQFVDLSSTIATLCSTLTLLKPSNSSSTVSLIDRTQIHSAPISSSVSHSTSLSPTPRSPHSPTLPSDSLQPNYNIPSLDVYSSLPSGPTHHPSKSLPPQILTQQHISLSSTIITSSAVSSAASGSAARRGSELSAVRFRDLPVAQKRLIAPFSECLSPEPPNENSQSGKIHALNYEEEEEAEAAALAEDENTEKTQSQKRSELQSIDELSLDANQLAKSKKRAARRAPTEFSAVKNSFADQSVQPTPTSQNSQFSPDYQFPVPSNYSRNQSSNDSSVAPSEAPSSSINSSESSLAAPAVSQRIRYRRFSTSALESDLKAATAAAISAPIGQSFTREPPAGSKRSSAPLPGEGDDEKKEVKPLDADDSDNNEAEPRDSSGFNLPPGVRPSTAGSRQGRRYSSVDDLKEFHAQQIYFDSDNRVKLNVGGQVFTTTISTLTREKAHPNMFNAMFSGNFQLERDEREAIFIDRDPTFFRHILNYLRDGSIHINGMSTLQKQALLREARYFGVTPLVSLLTIDARQMKNNARRELSSEKEYKLIYISGEKFDKELPIQFNKMTIHEGYDFESWISGGKTKGIFLLFSKKLSRGELMLLDRLQTGM